MYMIYFTVPEEYLEKVKQAIFETGAGKIGNYSNCVWQVLGEGQFMPLENSHAFIGEINKLEKLPEYMVQTVCKEANIQDVIAALKSAHPYESPSYQVIKVEDF